MDFLEKLRSLITSPVMDVTTVLVVITAVALWYALHEAQNQAEYDQRWQRKSGSRLLEVTRNELEQLMRNPFKRT